MPKKLSLCVSEGKESIDQEKVLDVVITHVCRDSVSDASYQEEELSVDSEELDDSDYGSSRRRQSGRSSGRSSRYRSGKRGSRSGSKKHKRSSRRRQKNRNLDDFGMIYMVYKTKLLHLLSRLIILPPFQ